MRIPRLARRFVLLTFMLMSILLLIPSASQAAQTPQIQYVIIDSGNGAGVQNALQVDAQGIPHIVYYNEAQTNFWYALCNNPQCTQPQRQLIDTEQRTGQLPNLQWDALGRPVIAYYTETRTGIVKLMTCELAPCTDSTITALNDNLSLDITTPNIALAISNEGMPILGYPSFQDLNIFSMELAICADPTCTEFTIAVLDDVGWTGRSPVIAVDENNHPRVAFYSHETREAKIAVCDDPLCESFTVHPLGPSGQFVSMVLNADGIPYIAFFEPQGKQLMLAICADPTCSSADVKRIAPGGDNVNLELDPNGNPILVYDVKGDQAIRLTVCRDAYCNDKLPPITISDYSARERDADLAIAPDGTLYITYYENNLRMAIVTLP